MKLGQSLNGDIECTGEERHGHYVIATSTIYTHVHSHTINEKDFNRLHHHPALEHNKFTLDELESTVDSLTLEF